MILHADAHVDAETSSSASRRPGLVARLLIALVHVYQHTLAHLLGGHCRFQPSCSHYALAVLRTHGACRGALRALGRLSRCHPFHPGGYDPPPPARRIGLAAPDSPPAASDRR